jgi:uncharacterized membrane protein YjfL (UPF0719 family)
LAIVKILSAIVLSVAAAYAGISLLDRLTPQIDEWKEIKKGNAAIGLLYASVIISLVLIVEPQISAFVTAIQPSSTLVSLLFGFVNYLLSVFFAIVAVYLSIYLIDRITVDVEEFAELKNNNVAMALIMAAILIGVALSLRIPFESIFNAMQSIEFSLY